MPLATYILGLRMLIHSDARGEFAWKFDPPTQGGVLYRGRRLREKSEKSPPACPLSVDPQNGPDFGPDYAAASRAPLLPSPAAAAGAAPPAPLPVSTLQPLEPPRLPTGPPSAPQRVAESVSDGGGFIYPFRRHPNAPECESAPEYGKNNAQFSLGSIPPQAVVNVYSTARVCETRSQRSATSSFRTY